MSQELRSIWGRIGMSMQFTPEEADIMLRDDTTNKERVEIMKRLFDEGRITPEGDSYIPGVCIDDYNSEYGMDYATPDDVCSADDVDWDMSW